MNKKIIILISILFLLVLSGTVFVFQKDERKEENNKSLLEEFSSGGFKNSKIDDNNNSKDLKNYSSQAVLIDDIIVDSNKKQELNITQSLDFFAKLGNDLFGIKREKIFQSVNGMIKLRENIKEEVAEPKIIKVPEDYKAIQLAIDSAIFGDTIKVSAGEYQENIIMKEGVSLIGSNELVIVEDDESEEESKKEIEEENENELDSNTSDPLVERIIINETIINGGDSGNVISFKNGITNKTKLANLTIKNAGKNLSGILIENSSPLVCDNIVMDNEYNVYIKGNSSPIIQKNNLRFGGKGIQVYNFEKQETEEKKEPDSEISEFDSSPLFILGMPIIVDNLITDNKIGIDLYQSSAIIDHNTISYNNHYKAYLGTTFGINLSNSFAEIMNNIVTDSGICELCAGINVDEKSKNIIISYNDIWNNKNNFICFGECTLEDNNISKDPLFIDPVNWNFELREESELIRMCDDGSDMGVRW